MFLYTLATVFNLFLTGWFEVNNLINFLISFLISHFSRTHSVSRSPSKLHWNLFERFFLDVHLAFTCAPASVHLTRKNAYAVVEIEDRNGSLRSPKPSFFSSLVKTWPNCSCWYFWTLLIRERGKKEETAWVRWRRTVPILLVCLILDGLWDNRTTFFKKICFLIKGQQKIGPMI